MEKHRNNSTTSKILEHLQSKGTITPLEALNLYGTFRLSVAINRLRKYHVISTDKPTDGKDYAVYRYICPILPGSIFAESKKN